MHISIGIDSTKFTREAMPAALRALAFSSSVAGFMPRIFFWFGQMMPHTFSSMIVPSQAPMPMTTCPGASAKALMRPDSASSQNPASQVARAAQRNQNSALGARYLVMAAPPGPPLSAAAAASPGVWTTLK